MDYWFQLTCIPPSSPHTEHEAIFSTIQPKRKHSSLLIRNRSKKGALKLVHKVLLLSRTIFDSVGRILLVFTWLSVLTGNFDPLIITYVYYGTAALLLMFNIVFNSSVLSCQPHYILGRDYGFTAT